MCTNQKVLITVNTSHTTEHELVVVREVNSNEPYFVEFSENSISLPTEILRMFGNGTEPVRMVFIYYRNMSGLLPGALPGDNQDSELASSIVSASLLCGEVICDTSDIKANSNVIITLQHLKVPQVR